MSRSDYCRKSTTQNQGQSSAQCSPPPHSPLPRGTRRPDQVPLPARNRLFLPFEIEDSRLLLMMLEVPGVHSFIALRGGWCVWDYNYALNFFGRMVRYAVRIDLFGLNKEGRSPAGICIGRTTNSLAINKKTKK